MSPVIDAIGIIVSDMTAALAFYRLLGFDIPSEVDAEGHVEVRTPGGIRILFDTEEVIRSFDPTWMSPGRGGRIGLAFLCEDPASVDATAASVAAAGHVVHREPWDAFWGQRYAIVVDPDGNHVDLFAGLG
jgi:catechol 2,3-dioxygenase-like lactoylglutathione lyase family enzyme